MKKYIWKDIVLIKGEIHCEEVPISGKMDAEYFQLDDFYEAVAKKHKIENDKILTYMMDNIDFNPKHLKFGAETCGCYIDGKAEWLQN